MEVAILVFGVIAALGAVAAVSVPLWQQRVRLELRFRDGFASAPDRISLRARVENPGLSPVYDVELFAGPRNAARSAPARHGERAAENVSRLLRRG